jgi:hypothetical protein
VETGNRENARSSDSLDAVTCSTGGQTVMAIEVENVNKGKSLELLAYEIAEAIAIGDRRKHEVCELLIAFAEEIKRQAVEP